MKLGTPTREVLQNFIAFADKRTLWQICRPLSHQCWSSLQNNALFTSWCFVTQDTKRSLRYPTCLHIFYSKGSIVRCILAIWGSTWSWTQKGSWFSLSTTVCKQHALCKRVYPTSMTCSEAGASNTKSKHRKDVGGCLSYTWQIPMGSVNSHGCATRHSMEELFWPGWRTSISYSKTWFPICVCHFRLMWVRACVCVCVCVCTSLA